MHLGLDSLVDAHFDYAEAENWHRDLRHYRHTRLKLLQELLACDIDKLADDLASHSSNHGVDPTWVDRWSVVCIARQSLALSARPRRPFGVWLEGGPGRLQDELRVKHGDAIHQADEAFRKAARQLFADALVALFDGVEGRNVDEDALFARGLPRTAPDPDDYW